MIFLLLTIGISFEIEAQGVNEKLLNSFYNQTIESYFSKIESESSDFYIWTDKDMNGVQTNYQTFDIHFVNEGEAKQLIRRNKISELYWTIINEVSKDTIDVLIGGWDVDYKRKLFKGNYFFSAWCRGNDGYVPQGRFIFNSETTNWDFISEEAILDAKILEYQSKLKE